MIAYVPSGPLRVAAVSFQSLTTHSCRNSEKMAGAAMYELVRVGHDECVRIPLP